MVSKSELKGLLKRELIEICNAQNIDLPHEVNLKAEYVDFMYKYKHWDPPLKQLIKEVKLGKKPSSRPKRSQKSHEKPEVEESDKKESLIEKAEIHLLNSLGYLVWLIPFLYVIRLLFWMLDVPNFHIVWEIM